MIRWSESLTESAQLVRERLELCQQGGTAPDASCAAWLREKDVVAIGADTAAVEATVRADPSPTRLGLHLVALRDLGVYMIATLDLEALAADGVYEFSVHRRAAAPVEGHGLPR